MFIHLLLLVIEPPGRGGDVTVDTCHDLTDGVGVPRRMLASPGPFVLPNRCALYSAPGGQEGFKLRIECLYHIGSILCLSSLHRWPGGRLLFECGSYSHSV